MAKPVGVRVYHGDTGETECPELAFQGFNDEGQEMWKIVGVVIRPDVDDIYCDRIEAGTALGFSVAAR